MKLAELHQSRINRKHEKRPQTYETVPDIVNILRAAAAEAPCDAGAAKPDAIKTIPCVSLDMFIAFREEFSGGWILWLGDEEVTTLTPELKQKLSSMTFDEKAAMFFRLSVWSKNSRASNALDIMKISDGAEVFVERVTGLSLYDNKLAQGNTSRIDTVTKVDDPEPEIENTDSCTSVQMIQCTDGSQTHRDTPLLRQQKRSRESEASSDLVMLQPGEERGLTQRNAESKTGRDAEKSQVREDRRLPKKMAASKKIKTE